MEYLSTGQLDVFYDPSILNVRTPWPMAGSVYDTLDRSAYCYDDGWDIWCDPATGCGEQSIGVLGYGGIDIGNPGGSSTSTSGCLRITWQDNWAQTETDGFCGGGNGSGQTGDGWITSIRFRAVHTGQSPVAIWMGNESHKWQVNQVVDWVGYMNYSYTGSESLQYGGNVTVNVTP
jgi:hypothetical protein